MFGGGSGDIYVNGRGDLYLGSVNRPVFETFQSISFWVLFSLWVVMIIVQLFPIHVGQKLTSSNDKTNHK
jgi:hypothetical protein